MKKSKGVKMSKKIVKRKRGSAKRSKNVSVPGRIHTKSGIKVTDILIQCRLPARVAKAYSAKAKAAKVSRSALVRTMLLKTVTMGALLSAATTALRAKS